MPGPVGYGWLSAGWGTGAFISALYAPQAIARLGGRRAVAFSMALLSVAMVCAPVSRFLVLAMAAYFVMGSARGVGGVAMNTSLMEMVPKHLMGRVQNTYYFAGTFLQIALALSVGAVAHRLSLVAAFAILACVYGFGIRGGELAGGNARRGRSRGRVSIRHPRVAGIGDLASSLSDCASLRGEFSCRAIGPLRTLGDLRLRGQLLLWLLFFPIPKE